MIRRHIHPITVKKGTNKKEREEKKNCTEIIIHTYVPEGGFLDTWASIKTFHSSPSCSPFLPSGLASDFCQIWRAPSWSKSENRMSKTWEYQETGWPSIPSLIFYIIALLV
jgi:hypothetical protein